VVANVAEFDDSFVQGIVSIFNETPVRQGKAFWHYHKDVDTVRRENGTYPENNLFLGAYYDDELIGFIRLICVDNIAHVVQQLSKIKHFDKRPANALMAKAVEVCAQKGMSHLVYCSYVYNDPKSSLTEFKRRNGFEQVLLPRYYIPLTLQGTIALKLGLHRGLVARIPKPVLRQLLKIRTAWDSHKSRAAQESL
jgi:hypothetical protein